MKRLVAHAADLPVLGLQLIERRRRLHEVSTWHHPKLGAQEWQLNLGELLAQLPITPDRVEEAIAGHRLAICRATDSQECANLVDRHRRRLDRLVGVVVRSLDVTGPDVAGAEDALAHRLIRGLCDGLTLGVVEGRLDPDDVVPTVCALVDAWRGRAPLAQTVAPD